MSNFDPALAASFDSEAGSGFSHSQAMPAPQRTAGDLLRDAREAAGLHIAALAASLKVPVKKLEALEQDRFDLLPDAVFVRALASSVCRTLKIDPTQVLERMPQSAAPRLAQRSASINAPFSSPADGPRASPWKHASRPAVLAVLALLLGALVLIFLPGVAEEPVTVKRDTEDGLAVAATEKPQSLPATMVMAGASLASGAAPEVSAAINVASASAAEGPVPAAPPGDMAVAPVTPQVAMQSTLPVAPVATAVATLTSPGAALAASAPVTAVPGGIVTFRAKQESWVEVTDAKGAVVLRRTLAPGEVAGASGALPLAAVVGRADATQVQVRGRTFDLTAVARDNVARFEVK